jgi:DNA-binding IclR family transcriptional regulator
VLLSDAARKAIAAMMLTEGLRARAVPGSHRAVADYAVRSVERSQDRAHLERFDGMRRNRDRVEYGTAAIGSQVVDNDLEHAAAIVEIAAARVGG